ncbi:MAG: hypothetical protein ACK4XM_12615, partial [Chloroherpetonaceae bacterium]
GQFKLIDEKLFGEEHQFYIPKDENDDSFEKLIELKEATRAEKEFSKLKAMQVRLEAHLRSMLERVVRVRLKRGESVPLSSEKVLGIRKLTQTDGGYSSIFGINLKGIENNFV